MKLLLEMILGFLKLGVKVIFDLAFNVLVMGFVYYKLYQWILIPFGLPPIGWIQLYALVFVYGIFTFESPYTGEDRTRQGAAPKLRNTFQVLGE